MVEALRVGVARRREGIDGHRGLVPLLRRRTVRGIGVVEEIAALERKLVAFAPRIGIVQSDRIDLRHTALGPHHVLAHAAAASARTARDAENVLEREVLLIDVVEQPDHRHAAVAREDIDVAAGDVLVLRLGLRVGVITVSSVEFSELSLTHAGLGHDIEGLVPLAVVHARELGRVGELVVNLHALDGLGRQRLDGRRHILAEELLAVHEDFLDLLALGLHRAVRDGDARHLLQQALDVGVGGHLEGPGIIAHRVALLRGAHGLDLLDHGLDLHARLELQHAERHLRRRDAEGRIEGVVAEERYRQSVLPVGERRNRHRSLVGGGEILFLLRIPGRCHGQDRADHALSGVGIHDPSRDGPGLCGGRRREERQQGSQ